MLEIFDKGPSTRESLVKMGAYSKYMYNRALESQNMEGVDPSSMSYEKFVESMDPEAQNQYYAMQAKLNERMSQKGVNKNEYLAWWDQQIRDRASQFWSGARNTLTGTPQQEAIDTQAAQQSQLDQYKGAGSQRFASGKTMGQGPEEGGILQSLLAALQSAGGPSISQGRLGTIAPTLAQGSRQEQSAALGFAPPPLLASVGSPFQNQMKTGTENDDLFKKANPYNAGNLGAALSNYI